MADFICYAMTGFALCQESKWDDFDVIYDNISQEQLYSYNRIV